MISQPPSEMSPEERFSEIAQLIATGYVRFYAGAIPAKAQGNSTDVAENKSAVNPESFLELLGHQRPHGRNG